MAAEIDETMPADGESALTAGAGPKPATSDLRVGDVVADKYRVERLLGQGGMGTVLAVTHLSLGEPYAIKYLTGDAARDPAAVARFVAEARAAVRIKSEHVVRVSDVGQLASGSPYIVMEQLSGYDLAQVLADHGPMRVETAVDYVLQACLGVAEAHALGMVHRDLKPSNLFLTQRLDGLPLVKVLDFGIAKALGDPSQSAVQTATDAVFGTPAYMSPEQIRSARNVDVRTDVWALGVILHELLAAELPFKADTVGGLLSAIAADPPTDVRTRRPDVAAALARVLSRCLEKNVADRFQTVSELASELEPFKSPESFTSVGRIRRLSGPLPEPLHHLSGHSSERIAIEPSDQSERLAQGPSTPTEGHASRMNVTTGHVTFEAGHVKPLHGRARVATLVGALALLGGGGLFALRATDSARARGDGPTSTTTAGPFAGAAVPGSPSHAPSVDTAAAPVGLVHVKVGAMPANAVISVDGRPVGNPHELEVARSTESHVLEVSAQGHASQTRSLVFDRDQDLFIALAKAPATAPVDGRATRPSDAPRGKRPHRTVDDTDPYQ